MPRTAASRGIRAASAVAMLFLFAAVWPAPSWAAGQGSIDHVEVEDSAVRVLYSIRDLPEGVSADLSSLEVTVDGRPVDAAAEMAATADTQRTVRRTAILAIDVSRSMRGERFAQAKLAAEAFLAGVSPDVYVGVVAFAGEVSVAQEPTRDREQSLQVLDALTLSVGTRLYDGAIQAVKAAGDDGQRSVLVLSDGKDTSRTPLDEVIDEVEVSGVRVDVVALAQADDALTTLESIADAGEGTVMPAGDPAALTELFSNEAAALAQQVLVTAELPSDVTAAEGTIGVAIEAGDEAYVDTAFVTLRSAPAVPDTQPPSPSPPASAPFSVSRTMMLSGLSAAGIGMLVLLLGAFGVFGGPKRQTIEDRVGAYSRNRSGGSASVTTPTAQVPSASLASSAVSMAEKALANNRGLAASIGSRLEAAGMSLKPAEWVLLHAGVAIGSGLVGFLVSGGGPLPMVLGLLLGSIAPWLYLGLKRSMRTAAFNGQLAETLQLIAGGLSAGLSLAQSVDTVVRQGSEPMKTEFKRALVEARLGVSIEDALESIGDRMQSKDFAWVVIAIRIQREVGGNLAEVLSQVAATIRERGYLQRQVKSLSAEGKMSAWILGLLPVVVFLFLFSTNRAYFEPMLSSLIGWIMLGGALGLMAIAVVWMRKLIKMEV